MALRKDWQFEHSASEVLAASEMRAEYHRARWKHWVSTATKLDQEMTKNARVEEQPITGGTQRVLRYDPGLQAELNQATARRDHHFRELGGYETWVSCLTEEKPDKTLYLDVDDVTYFFHKDPE